MNPSRTPVKAHVNRRTFLAATSATVLAGGLEVRGQSSEKLAVEGGPKAVRAVPKLPRRWGAAERARLEALVGQDTLFYWKGPRTTAFVERFRQVCPMQHVMPCSSGTAALHIAAAAAGIGPGDEVITSPITDIGTVIGVIYQQGVPVFADLGRSTYNLDPADVARRITPKTKAIIAVHLCGNPCDMEALRALADRHKLILIEDCAQAWGARHRGQSIGTTGHLACWSLQNSKHVTCGDGGVVASNDPKFGPLLQRFGDKGMDRLQPGLFHHFATNYRITEAQTAIAEAQLEKLEGIAATRSKLGTLLSDQLRGVPGILPHSVHPEDRCVFWFYFLRIDPAVLTCSRAQFHKALAAEGVECSAGYIPVPLYGNPVFQQHGFFAGRWPVKEMGLTAMDYTKVSCPEAEAILQTGLRLTLHEAMTEEYIQSAATAVKKVARAYRA